jgi:uncharacterized protein DUF4235
MKILYKPFALIAAFIAARIGRTIFRGLWSRIDDAEPPAPSAPNSTFPKVIGAAALEAVTMATVGAAADRASARAFFHLTGVWPGDDPEKKDE